MTEENESHFFVVTFYSTGSPNKHVRCLVIGVVNHLAAIACAVNNKSDLISISNFSDYSRIESLRLFPTKNSGSRLYRI